MGREQQKLFNNNALGRSLAQTQYKWLRERVLPANEQIRCGLTTLLLVLNENLGAYLAYITLAAFCFIGLGEIVSASIS